MAAGILVVLSMAAVTLADARRVYPQDTRGEKPTLDVSVIVRLDNNAGVPDQILSLAKARTAEIYRRMGVSLAWLDAHEVIRQEIRPPYTMVLTSPQAEKREALSEGGVTEDALGQAVPTARRAYVFYDRVQAKVLLPHRDTVALLGYAMAHELGHLMLPPNSHSATGVMRPNFDMDPRVIPSFTKAEATAIRRRLSDDERTWDFKMKTKKDTRLQPLRLWAGVLADPAEVESQVLLGFVDSDRRFAVQGAVDGAAARLSRPNCQDVLSDFADESGHRLRTKLLVRGTSPAEAFAALRFVDSHAAPQCSAGTTLAFTQTGSPVIHVCAGPFMKRSMRNRQTAEIIVIHEFLHTLGLGENPPTSEAITAQVALRCGG